MRHCFIAVFRGVKPTEYKDNETYQAEVIGQPGPVLLDDAQLSGLTQLIFDTAVASWH